MTTMLKSPDVAARVNVSTDTLKRWRRLSRRDKKLYGPPFTRTETGGISYPEDQLEQWLKDRTVTA